MSAADLDLDLNDEDIAACFDAMEDEEEMASRWGDIQTEVGKDASARTRAAVLHDMHVYAREQAKHVRCGGVGWHVPIGALHGKLGAPSQAPCLRAPEPPKPTGKEMYFEGTIDYVPEISTPPDQIFYRPSDISQGGNATKHLFVLNGRQEVFSNDNLFAAIPHAFFVRFYAKKKASPDYKGRPMFVVTRLLEKRHAENGGILAVLNLAAHALRESISLLRISTMKAGYDEETDTMRYTAEVEGALYCSGMIEMDFMDEGFSKGSPSLQRQCGLAREIFDCIQWMRDNRSDRAYTAQWERAYHSLPTALEKDEALRREIYSLREKFADCEAPLVVKFMRHPETIAYFAGPALELLAPLFGEEVLLGVGIDQLWALYKDISEGCTPSAEMLETAYGMCFYREHSRTMCSYGMGTKHAARNVSDFTFGDIASFPTEYTAVHGSRLPLPLPEVNFVSLASAPEICARLGCMAVMEILVYNLVKQAHLEDRHSCDTVDHLVERVSVEAFSREPSETYRMLRSSYRIARHEATRSEKDALIAATCLVFGRIRHSQLASLERHRRSAVLCAIGNLVRKGILFMERACVADIFKAVEEHGDDAVVLETISEEEAQACTWLDDLDTDMPAELMPVVQAERRMRDMLTCLYWEPRKKYRLYLPEVYYQEEMLLQALNRHASAQRASSSSKPRIRNAFYAEAQAKKWNHKETIERAKRVNALLQDLDVAVLDAVESGTEDDPDLLLAERCSAEGMRRVHFSEMELAPDQQLAVEVIERSKYGVTVLQGPAGAGKTAIAKALRDPRKLNSFMACAFMNSHCRNMQRSLGGIEDSNVLTLDRLSLAHEMLCRNEYMRAVLTETEAYKKEALHGISVFGFFNNIQDYNRCPLETLRVFFMDEYSAMPLATVALDAYIVSQCAPRLRSIIFAGDMNQLPSIAPSPLGFALPIGLGHVPVTSKWRYSDINAMHNVDAILSGKMQMRFSMRDEGAAVLIKCNMRWKEAYYNHYPDCVIALLVQDFKKGLLPLGRTLVVVPSNELARIANRHLCTEELRMLAQSSDAMVASRAQDDMVRFRVSATGSGLLATDQGCFYRGQRVIATTSMDTIGVPNRTEFIVGDDVHYRILHIRAADMASLHQMFLEAVCDEVINFANEKMTSEGTPIAVLVRALNDSKTSALYKAIVYSRAANYARTVIEEHSHAQRLRAEAVLGMLSAGLPTRKVERYLSCGGTGARHCFTPGVASDVDCAPDTLQEYLCLHSPAAAEWKKSPFPPKPANEETKRLTDWLQGREAITEAITKWMQAHQEDYAPLREELEPLFRRSIKRAVRILSGQLDSEEAMRLSSQLHADIANSLITERNCGERPPQAALRLALEDYYLATSGLAQGVHPSDYIAAVLSGEPSTSRLATDAPILHFVKLYEVSSNGKAEDSTRIVYFPAGASFTQRLAPATVQTCYSSQSQEKDVGVLVMPSFETRNYVFTGYTRARKRVRIYSSESVLESSLSRHPNVAYSVLAAKLRYAVGVSYVNEEPPDSAQRSRIRKLCQKLSKKHADRMRIDTLEGETVEDALFRLSRHSRSQPFVEPVEMGLPPNLSPPDKWLLEEMAQNGDVLYRPKVNLPCNVMGVSREQAADERCWDTEMQSGCEWNAVKEAASSAAWARNYIQRHSGK